jgi:hypothetical protein
MQPDERQFDRTIFSIRRVKGLRPTDFWFDTVLTSAIAITYGFVSTTTGTCRLNKKKDLSA